MHPFVLISVLTFTLIFLRLAMDQGWGNNLLNKIFNQQTFQLSKADIRSPTPRIRAVKVIIDQYRKNFQPSFCFVFIFFCLVNFLLDSFTAAFLLFYFSVFFSLKQFYFGSKTFAEFSNFLISFFKNRGKVSFQLNQMLLSNDKSNNFAFLRLLLIPLAYSLISPRFVSDTKPLWLEEYMPGNTDFWWLASGLLVFWALSAVYLLCSSGLFEPSTDSSRNSGMQKLEITQGSHPSKFLSHSRDLTLRVLNGLAFLGILLGFFYMNRAYPRRLFFFVTGAGFAFIHLILRYKQDLNQIFLFRRISNTSLLKGNVFMIFYLERT